MRYKGYQLYIDGLLMPIAPEEYKIKVNGKNKVVSLLNGNDLNLIKGPGLTEITAKIRLPSNDFPSVMAYQPQSVFLDKFESVKSNDTQKKVFPFVLLREFPNRDIDPIRFELVTLEDYTFDEDAKSGMDILVALNFKQYIPAPVMKIEEPKQKENIETPLATIMKIPTRISARAPMLSATVSTGMTMLEFAKKHTGDFGKAVEIAEKNFIDNWNDLKDGMRLKL